MGTSASGAHEETSAALLRFNLGGVAPSSVASAILQLRVVAAGGNPRNAMTVLGLKAGAWDEGTVTWASAPNLAPLSSGANISSIGQNFLDWASPAEPDIAGHLSTAPGEFNSTLRVDVTDYIRSGAGSSFLLARLFRQNPSGSGTGAIAGDSLAGSRVVFGSREAADAGAQPSLMLLVQ